MRGRSLSSEAELQYGCQRRPRAYDCRLGLDGWRTIPGLSPAPADDMEQEIDGDGGDSPAPGIGVVVLEREIDNDVAGRLGDLLTFSLEFLLCERDRAEVQAGGRGPLAVAVLPGCSLSPPPLRRILVP